MCVGFSVWAFINLFLCILPIWHKLDVLCILMTLIYTLASLIPKAIPHQHSLQPPPDVASLHLCSTACLDTSNPKVSGADVLPAELHQWWIEDGKGLINLANATMFGTPMTWCASCSSDMHQIVCIFSQFHFLQILPECEWIRLIPQPQLPHSLSQQGWTCWPTQHQQIQ